MDRKCFHKLTMCVEVFYICIYVVEMNFILIHSGHVNAKLQKSLTLSKELFVSQFLKVFLKCFSTFVIVVKQYA